MFKQFVGIYFEGSWQIVPSSWITKFNNKSFCLWPNKGNVEDLAKWQTMPDKSWSLWPVTKIAETSGELFLLGTGNDYVLLAF